MQIVPVTAENLRLYLNLAQSYEGEFSAITGKQPGPDGLFALDTPLTGDIQGYLMLLDSIPLGITAIAHGPDQHYEICEFYVVPSVRKRDLGRRFAHALWQQLPGHWQIKQLPQAQYASAFWRKTIASFAVSFHEDQYLDPYWGTVQRQRFSVAPTLAA